MAKAVIQPFENFVKSRIRFVQKVAEYANHKDHIEKLEALGVLTLLKHLLKDRIESIRQSAAVALGRMAAHKEEMAEAIVATGMIPIVIASMKGANVIFFYQTVLKKYYKEHAANLLKNVSNYPKSSHLAEAIIKDGGLPALVDCLEEFDPIVKTAGAKAFACIARHSAELAEQVVNAKAVRPLVDCLNEENTKLKHDATEALTEIARHNKELARTVVNEGAIPSLTKLLSHVDAHLKRQVCACLAYIAGHETELADAVVSSEVLHKMPACLKDVDIKVRMNAASILKEVARTSFKHSSLIMNLVGPAVIVDFVSNCTGLPRLPGIETIGFVAKDDESLAKDCIKENAHIALKDVLMHESNDKIKERVAWALGKLGKHTADHANALAEADILQKLLDTFAKAGSNATLKKKTKGALIRIIQKCNKIPLIETLIEDHLDLDILTCLVEQCYQLLPISLEAKKYFLQCGGFKKLQHLRADGGTKLKELRDKINGLYPPEVVQYYAPDAKERIIKKIEEAQD